MAVGNDAPLGGMTGIEVFLHGAVRRTATAFGGEAGVALVDVDGVRQQQERRCTELVGERKRRSSISSPEMGVQFSKRRTRVKSGTSQFVSVTFSGLAPVCHGEPEIGPERGSDAPVTTDFVLEVEAGGNAIVGGGLVLGLQLQKFLNEFGW